jgi:hypothetical protein
LSSRGCPYKNTIITFVAIKKNRIMNNKKAMLVIASFCLALTSGQAQKKYSEKVVYNDAVAEGDGMSIKAKDGVSNKEMTKFNLKISNKGDDILLYKPEESTLKANGKEVKPKEKWLEIPPTETDNRVVNFTGNDYMVPGYSFVVDGVYKISTTSKSIQTPDFQLPPSQNEFKTGNFTCNMIDLSKETDKTSVKFECRYTGEKFGVIHAGRAAVKLPDGTEIANAKSKSNPVVLAPGESKKVTLYWNRMDGGKATDMQKIKLMIVWNNTFIEADPVKVKPVTLEFTVDEAKSK